MAEKSEKTKAEGEKNDPGYVILANFCYFCGEKRKFL
jgi:hypothetical protein